jgi:hypothetical protein
MNQARWIVVMLVLCGMLGTLTVLHRVHRLEVSDGDSAGAGAEVAAGPAADASPDLFAGRPAEIPGATDLLSAQFELGPPAPQCVTVEDTTETSAAFHALQERFEVLREP